VQIVILGVEYNGRRHTFVKEVETPKGKERYEEIAPLIYRVTRAPEGHMWVEPLMQGDADNDPNHPISDKVFQYLGVSNSFIDETKQEQSRKMKVFLQLRKASRDTGFYEKLRQKASATPLARPEDGQGRLDPAYVDEAKERLEEFFRDEPDKAADTTRIRQEILDEVSAKTSRTRTSIRGTTRIARFE